MARKLDNCCGFIELRKGCFIIGYFQMVQLIVSIILGIVFAIYFRDNYKVVTNTPELDEEASMVVYMIVMVSVITTVVLWTVMLIFTILLVVGLHKNIPGLLTAYLAYCVLFYLLYIMGLIINLTHGGMGITSFSINSINLGLGIYFMMVVRSYKDEMKNGSVNTVNYAQF